MFCLIVLHVSNKRLFYGHSAEADSLSHTQGIIWLLWSQNSESAWFDSLPDNQLLCPKLFVVLISRPWKMSGWRLDNVTRASFQTSFINHPTIRRETVQKK
jgi:hypothetical protein